MDRRHSEACCECSKLVQVAIEIWIRTDDERPHFQFDCLGEGRVNISASARLKNCSFDPKQGLSLSRLTNFFGIVWIAVIWRSLVLKPKSATWSAQRTTISTPNIISDRCART